MREVVLQQALAGIALVYVVLFVVGEARHKEPVWHTATLLVLLVVGVVALFFVFWRNVSTATARLLLRTPKVWFIACTVVVHSIVRCMFPDSPASDVNALAYAVSVLYLVWSDVLVYRHRGALLLFGGMSTVYCVTALLEVTVGRWKERGLVAFGTFQLKKRVLLRANYATTILLLVDGLSVLCFNKEHDAFCFVKGPVRRNEVIPAHVFQSVTEADVKRINQLHRLNLASAVASVLSYLFYSQVYFDAHGNALPAPVWFEAVVAISFAVEFVSLLVSMRNNTCSKVVGMLARQPNLWIVLSQQLLLAAAGCSCPNHNFLTPLYALGTAFGCLVVLVVDVVVVANRPFIVMMAALVITVCVIGVVNTTAFPDKRRCVFLSVWGTDFYEVDAVRSGSVNTLLLVVDSCVRIFRDKTRECFVVIQRANVPRFRRHNSTHGTTELAVSLIEPTPAA